MNRFLFSGSNLVELSSSVSGCNSNNRVLFGSRVIATLFNGGRHLYFDQNWPRRYFDGEQRLHFLRYMEFCGVGRHLSDVHIQHMGHLYGLNGGPAQVAVSCCGVLWKLRCVKCRLYHVIDFGGPQAVFVSKEPVVLPRSLLSFG